MLLNRRRRLVVEVGAAVVADAEERDQALRAVHVAAAVRQQNHWLLRLLRLLQHVGLRHRSVRRRDGLLCAGTCAHHVDERADVRTRAQPHLEEVLAVVHPTSAVVPRHPVGAALRAKNQLAADGLAAAAATVVDGQLRAAPERRVDAQRLGPVHVHVDALHLRVRAEDVNVVAAGSLRARPVADIVPAHEVRRALLERGLRLAHPHGRELVLAAGDAADGLLVDGVHGHCVLHRQEIVVELVRLARVAVGGGVLLVGAAADVGDGRGAARGTLVGCRDGHRHHEVEHEALGGGGIARLGCWYGRQWRRRRVQRLLLLCDVADHGGHHWVLLFIEVHHFEKCLREFQKEEGENNSCFGWDQ
eukprot:PhM_4_TR10054/c1_g1_i1/m.42525